MATPLKPVSPDGSSGDAAPTELLALPAGQAVRRIALSHLDRAHSAFERLEAGDDDDALHDFRVEFRRFRSTVEAYRGELRHPVAQKLIDRARRIVGPTSPGRDAEVQLDWLASIRRELRPHHRPGHDWLVARIGARREAAYADVLSRVGRRFRRGEPKLRARLRVFQIEVDVKAGTPPLRPFRELLAEALDEATERLAGHLANVRSADDEREAHEARIAGKRLRYLLEPVGREVPEGRFLIKRSRRLQDALGEIHDAQVLAGDLREWIEQAAADRAGEILDASLVSPDAVRQARRRDPRAGIVAVARRNRERRDARFRDLGEDSIENDARALIEGARSLAASLR